MEDVQLPSGYDEDFLKEIDEDFQCLICQLPLREPVLTICGHRFCRKCLEKHFQRQESESQACTCPVDREDLNRQKVNLPGNVQQLEWRIDNQILGVKGLKDMFPDKATERKILSFNIKCPSDGCDWTGELRYKEDHLLSCSFQLIPCTNENCRVLIKRKELEDHMNDSCQWTKVLCDHCNELQPKCLLQDHIDGCARKPLECPNSCGETVAYEEMENHTKIDCPLTVVSCLYEKMGCTTKLQKKELDSHLESAVRLHLDLACVKLNATQEKVKKFEETTSKLELRIADLETKLLDRGRLTRYQASKLQSLDREISKLKQESQPYMWKIEGFRDLFRDARRSRGREYSLESGYFFGGPNGYKLMAEMYPNGNSEGKNTHLSVYFYIMRGKYDAVLPWPFRKTVKITLIDLEEGETHGNNHVLEFNTADLYHEKAFARPTRESNTGYGFPTFISHRDLFDGPYIVDDTIFLKIQVGPPTSPWPVFGFYDEY